VSGVQVGKNRPGSVGLVGKLKQDGREEAADVTL